MFAHPQRSPILSALYLGGRGAGASNGIDIDDCLFRTYRGELPMSKPNFCCIVVRHELSKLAVHIGLSFGSTDLLAEVIAMQAVVLLGMVVWGRGGWGVYQALGLSRMDALANESILPAGRRCDDAM